MNKELIEELKAQDFNVVAVSKTRTKEEIDEICQNGANYFWRKSCTGIYR